MSQYLNGEKRAADRPDDGVDGVPDRINPWYFVGEKLEHKKDAGNDDNNWVAKNGEGLVLRRQNDPVEMDGKAGGKNREI